MMDDAQICDAGRRWLNSLPKELRAEALTGLAPAVAAWHEQELSTHCRDE